MSTLQHPAPGTYSLAGFGPREPIKTPAGWSESFHRGRDFSLGGNTFPVVAARAGRVRWAYYSAFGGNEVLIEHTVPGYAYFATRYAHLASIDPRIRPGQQVSGGQRLGMAGDTGRAAGTHLHFEVFTNAKLGTTQRDPDPFLPATILEDDVALTEKQATALDWLYDRRSDLDIARSMITQLWNLRYKLVEIGKTPNAEVEIDAAAMAAEIAEALPADLAQQVADELHKRLAG